MKTTIRLTESDLTAIIEESIKKTLSPSVLCEMAMNADKLADKYGEIVSAIIDNIVCVCLYPNCLTVTHWKNRIPGLCQRFITIDVEPSKRNTPSERMKILSKGVNETLNPDYSAILNHFKSVSEYYSTRPDPHNNLTPVKPYAECYEENKEKVINAIITITQYTANQDMMGLNEFINQL